VTGRAVPALLLACSLAAASCAGGSDDTVVLLTHESFVLTEEAAEAFRAETGLSVEVLKAGDAGAVLNQAILTAGNPVADVIFGIDTTFLSRALDADLLVPYESPALGTVVPGLAAGPLVTPITFGDVCLNYDRAAFDDGLPPPSRLEDLADPAYRDMTVVQDPATSSPGLSFLLATIARFGDEGGYTWRDYWADLAANGVEVASGWEDAYYGSFSGSGSGGTRPIVVSYASSPPAEVLFAETPLTEAPTAIVTDGCFRQVEYAGILQGTDREVNARLLVDFLLSPEFQEDVPLTMFVFPAVAGTPLPPEFIEHAVVPDAPLALDPEAIETGREAWIEQWAQIVLR